MLIPGGMHMEALKKGDIVLNAKQTADLLKSGRAAGHGKAYADGTVGNIRNLISSSLSAYAKGTFSPVAVSHAYAEGSDEDPFDFIEIKLDRLERQIDRFLENAEWRESLSGKLTNYQSAINATEKLIATQNSAYNRYMSQANSIGLDESIKKLVRDGTIDVTQYGEETQKLIDKYQEWYEKALDCKDAIAELRNEQKELLQQKFDAIVDYYEVRTDTANAYTDRYESLANYRDQVGYSRVSDTQRQMYKDQMTHEQWNLTHLQRALDSYEKEFEKQMKSGAITKYSEAWYSARAQIQEFEASIYDSRTALSELEEQIRTIDFERFENAVNKFENWSDTLSGILNLKEARGETVTEYDYNRQLKANNLSIDALYKQREAFAEEQARYAVNSEKYQEMSEAIQECDIAILDLLADNEELKDSIREYRWSDFKEGQEEIDFMISELDHLMSLLNDEGFVDPDTGFISDQGYAQVGLATKGIEIYTQKIADYRTALEKLQEDLDNGNISQSEYTEESREFIEAIQDSTSAIQDYKDAIVDLYIEEQEKQNELLQEEISLRQDALDKKRSYYEYDRKISEKNRDVNALQAQIAALSGVSSAAARAELARLQDELREAQDDLNDTRKDHEFDLRDDAYDEMSDNANKALDRLTESVRSNMEVQQQVITDMLNVVKDKYKEVFSEISDVISQTGLVTSESLADALASLSNQSGASNSVNNALKNPNNVTGSDSITNTNTSTIVTGNETTEKAEQAASEYESTKNRKLVVLKLNKTSISVKEKKSYKITAQMLPSDATKSIKWKSSNTKIATVSNGSIKGVKAGSATITCYDEISGLSATCSVTVTATPKKNANITSSGGGKGTNGVVEVAGGLYLRSDTDARKTNNKITLMPNGAKVTILDSAKAWNGETWYKVKYGSKTGWSNANYIKKYARGTERITHEQLGLIDEEGREMLVTKHGILTRLYPGEGVIPHNLTENLMEIGKMNFGDMLKNLQRSSSPVYSPTINRENKINISLHYDNLLSVSGDVTKEALPPLKEILKQSCTYTANYLKKEMNKLK